MQNLKIYLNTKSVTKIGEGAFIGCSELQSLTVMQDNLNYSSYDGILYDKNRIKLLCCPGAKSNYNFPNSVTSIEERAFCYSERLTSISIPNSVTSIGNYAFLNCFKMSSITIPNSVKVIGDYAFESCNELKSIYNHGKKPAICGDAFSMYNETFDKIILYVPIGSSEAYKNSVMYH